jgi:hypothetical protein
MDNVVINTILAHVPSEWKNEGIEPVYYLYVRFKKHCDKARSFKAVDGKTYWECRHDNPGPLAHGG